MEQLERARTAPFLVATAAVAVLSLAVIRLNETFVEQLRRGRPFGSGESGWLYRLLVIAAIAQALYVGFVVLRSERVASARTRDPKLARLGRVELMRSVARNAAAAGFLTIVYGLSAFALTGERGGYWLFFTVVVLQLAWYYRSCGQIAAFLKFQPEYVTGEAGVPPLQATAHPYTPPLARGVDEATEPE